MQRNPFSTRFTKPGRIPFVFPKGGNCEDLLAKLAAPKAQGAIVGPHGSGKSTLLEMLSQRWNRLGLSEQRVRLTASIRTKNIPLRNLHHQSILVVDGFEQLAFWRRWWITQRCRQRGARLLVTAHAACGLPILLQTQPTWPLALQLTRDLIGCPDNNFESQWFEIWQDNPGDIRDYFFRLYHWCESNGLYRCEDDFLPQQVVCESC